MKRSLRSRTLLCVALVATIVSTAACGSDDEGGSAPTDPPADSAAPSESSASPDGNADPIRIGASVAKTGGQTFFGGPAMIAAQAAIADINAAGGVNGRPLELIWEDSQTDFAKSAEAAEKVIDQGAEVMLVDCDFDFGLPAAQVAQDNGIVAMNLCAGAPAAGDPSLLPLGFSMGSATNVEASVIAAYGYQELGFRKAYLLRDNSIEYSKSLCNYFEDAWTALGGEIVGVDEFNNSDTAVQGQVSNMLAAQDDYDVMTICSYAPGLVTAVRQIRASGIETPMLGSLVWDGAYWLGEGGAGELSNAYFPAFGSIWGDDPRPKVNELTAAAADEMGDTPFTSFLIPGYSAIEAIAKGIEIAGTTEGAALTAALESFSAEELLVGPVTYSSDVHTRMLGLTDFAILAIEGGVPSFVTMYQAPEEIIPEP